MNIHKLTSLAKSAKTRSIVSLFDQKERINDFSLSTPHLYLDYPKQNINEVELKGLIEIAEDVGLSESITHQFDGDKINNTEGRSVLHTVLRAPQAVKQQVLGETLAHEDEAAE
jgi:glucose-6-phosphate isomerase